MKSDELVEVARIGKTVGLKGGLKLHFLNDFPEVFCKNAIFETKNRGKLEVLVFDKQRELITFKEYLSIDDAKQLTNTTLYMTKEQTKEHCKLEEDEFFWFDIIGCDVYEDTTLLGKVDEIERIATFDYLCIKVSSLMTQKGFSKSFLIPYVKRYINSVDIEKKSIKVSGGLELLESL